MKLRPKPLLRKKKGIILKPKKIPKRFPLSTQNKSWTDEEREEFILNSYTGKYNPANSRWSNFPYKPEMLRREVISSIERLEELAVKWRNVPVFAFDTETNTLRVASYNKDFRCVCITFSWGENDNYEIPLGYLREEDVEAGRNLDFQRVVEIIRPIFENPNVMLVGHNLKFDLHVLARIGIFPVTKLMFDTMLSSWICDENTPNGLKENSAEKMGVPQQHFKEVTDSIPNEVKKRFGYKANSKVYDFGLVLIDDGEFYCIGDSFFTWCNFLGFRKEIIDEKMDKIYYHKMVPFLKVLFKMEEQGTTVDVETLKRMQKEMEEDIEKLSYAIIEKAGCVFNIGSSVQKSLLLYGLDDYELDFDIYLEKYKKKNAKRLANSKKGLDVKEVQRKYLEKKNDKERLNILKHSFNFPVSSYTASNSPSTDSDAIWRISKKTYKNNRRKQEGADMCKLILEYSKLSKLKTAFADGILEQLYEDGKAHPSFNQIGCVEGNTLIPTDKGLFPIQSLKESWVDGVRLSSNLSVVNRYGFIEKSSHLVQFKDVETKKIKTHLGVELECSNIHPILCNTFTTTEYYANKDSCRSKEIFYSETSKVWIKAEDLTTDNYVFVPVGYNTFSAKNYSFDLSGVTYERNTNAKEFKIPDSMSKELAEFLGIYYADGSIHSNNGTFSIRITNSNCEVLNRVKYLSMKLFGVEAIVYDTGETDREVNITSIGLAPIEFLYEMKRGCVNKLIPNCVLQSRREIIISFIKGLTLDSHIVFEDKKTYLVIVVSNKISASYLQSILFNLGIISSVTQDKSKTDNVFRVSIYNEEYEKFRDTIGFIEKSKFVYITKNQNHSNNYIKADKGIWLKIKSIESGFNTVYDFSVPETHSFISGSIISHNTDSGRLSCSSPNLQQLPKAEEDDKYQIRSVFIGSDYSCNSDGTYKSDEVSVWDRKKGNVKRKKIIAIDYHNLEMVCLTHFSHDKNLSEMFANDDDAHGSTAVNMFNLDCTPVECKKKYPHLRQVSKTLNFLLMYGGGAKLLYENLKADHYAPLDLGGEEFLKQYSCRTGEEVAQCIIDKYFTTYSGVAQFIAKQKKFAHKNGYVRTILGRKRRLPDINSRDMKKSSYCERLSVNSAIQGTAGDITISAQLRIDSEERLKELGCNMLIQVHDELVFECPEENLEEAIEIIKYDMEHPFGDTEDRMVKYLRADYDTGSSYQEAK